MEVASGKYVILLHADDELQPRFLTRAVEMLDSRQDVGLVHCAVEHIDESGAPLSSSGCSIPTSSIAMTWSCDGCCSRAA